MNHYAIKITNMALLLLLPSSVQYSKLGYTITTQAKVSGKVTFVNMVKEIQDGSERI
jgi:hypothetical protein